MPGTMLSAPQALTQTSLPTASLGRSYYYTHFTRNIFETYRGHIASLNSYSFWVAELGFEPRESDSRAHPLDRYTACVTLASRDCRGNCSTPTGEEAKT